MIPPPIRPTFEHAVCMDQEELIARLRSAFEGHDEHYPNQIRGPHIVVTVPRRERRFWSPWLTMEVMSAEPGIILHGRFSPKPSIWTGFMLCYITLGTSGFFAMIVGLSKALMGSSGVLWDILGAGLILVALGLYVSSQIGQRLAHDQMTMLHDLVREALGLEEHTHR